MADITSNPPSAHSESIDATAGQPNILMPLDTQAFRYPDLRTLVLLEAVLVVAHLEESSHH